MRHIGYSVLVFFMSVTVALGANEPVNSTIRTAEIEPAFFTGGRMVRLPETDQGYRSQALLVTLKGNSESEYLQFVTDNYAKHLLTDEQLGGLVQQVVQLRTLLADTYLNSLQASAEVYRLEMVREGTGQSYLLSIYFEEADRHKIKSIRIE